MISHYWAVVPERLDRVYDGYFLCISLIGQQYLKDWAVYVIVMFYVFHPLGSGT